MRSTISDIDGPANLNLQFRHDIRILMGEITQLSAAGSHKNDAPWLYSRLKSINGISIALSASTNFVEYIEAEAANVELIWGRFSFVRTIDRVLYSAEYLSAKYNSSPNINKKLGADCQIYGPDVFDFIPFSILQNCIKYSPRAMPVEVSAFAGQDGTCFAHFSSWGPFIEADEEEAIFSNGYRGVHAQISKIEGRGIGLYHARRAARELFGGDIKVKRGEVSPISIDNVPYANNEFILSVLAS